MLPDFKAGDMPRDIQPHQQGDRFAGIGRDRGNVGGAYQIAEQPGVAVHRRGQRLAREGVAVRRLRKIVLQRHLDRRGTGRQCHTGNDQDGAVQPEIH